MESSLQQDLGAADQDQAKPPYPENAADAVQAFPLRLPLAPLVPEGTAPSYKPSSPALCFQVGCLRAMTAVIEWVNG